MPGLILVPNPGSLHKENVSGIQENIILKSAFKSQFF